MLYFISSRATIVLSILLIFWFDLSACRSAQVTPTTLKAPTEAALAIETPIIPLQVAPSTDSVATDTYAAMRQGMVEQQLKGRDITDEAVLAAMAAVPRHEFVSEEFLTQAYNDHPLPIGYGQTISQPYIVALMTQLVDLQPGERVLEIGTGSGYQAAVLAQLTDHVYTIEIIPELAERAGRTFARLGYTQIETRQADGYWGWEDHAPFDAIIVTAAPDHVPQPLVNQLADGGKMVIPIGPPGGYQSLWVFERKGEEIIRKNWGGVRFVPLTRSE